MSTIDLEQQTEETRHDPPEPRRPAEARPRRLRRIATGVLAAGAATAAWALARAVGVEVVSPGIGANPVAPIGATHVIAAVLVAWAAGWGALAALERFVPARALTLWLVSAAVVLIASLGAPLTGAGITVASRVVLVSLHLVVAAGLAAGFTGSRR